MSITAINGLTKSLSRIGFSGKNSENKGVKVKTASVIAAAAIAGMQPGITANAEDEFVREAKAPETVQQWHPHRHHHHHRCIPYPGYPLGGFIDPLLVPYPVPMPGLQNRIPTYDMFDAPVNIEGITFNEYDISNVEKFEDDYGNDINVVTMTDGTKIEFPGQPVRAYAQVFRNEYATVFAGLYNAKVYDTANNDSYVFTGCRNLDVYADLGDDSDDIKFTDRIVPAGFYIRARKNRVRYNENDYINEVYMSRNGMYGF